MSAAAPLQDLRVIIIGLGLMGGSLAGALRSRCREVVGVARRAETVELAMRRELIDRGTTDLAAAVCGSDIVVLATPVRVILRHIAEIGPLLRDGCLLMDLGSTKAQIAAQMSRLPDHVQPLGGHPMCGKEASGIEAADPALYQGCKFILTPLLRTSPAALAIGCELVNAVGAHPLVLDPERQDSLVAAFSHLPYLLACALVAVAGSVAAVDPAAREILASGFRDTSRLAGSDATMMVDILVTNREEVLKAVRACQAELGDLVRRVESGDGETLRARLAGIRAERARMCSWAT